MRALKISLLVFILTISVPAQWEWQNGLPPQQNTLKVLFINSDTAFAVGDKGLIMKSTDSGLNWHLQSSNIELILRDICFINNEIGLAIGDSGIILKTSNSGINWVKREIEPKINLRAIHFLDLNNAWVCGESGLIVHTSDCGESWEIQNSGITGLISDIHFSNLFDGCATGYDGFFLHTSDGGNMWESMRYIGEKIRAMDFTNDSTGYAVSSSYFPPPFIHSNFWKTTNTGKTWNSWGIGITSFIIRDIVFISDLIGFGVDYDGSIFKTENSVEWEQVFCCLWPNNFNSISFYDNNRGIAVSSSGQIYCTSNTGDDWTLMFEDIFFGHLTSADFNDLNNGWTVGTTGFGTPGTFSVLLKTIDGGQSWAEKFRLTNNPLYKVFFINATDGWIGGYAGALYKSSDTGENWINKSLDSTSTIWDIFFINEYTGWLIHGRTLKKTSNGGENWFIQKEFPLNNINKLFFIDEYYGWLTIGDYNLGKILRTTNGGLEWIDSPDISGYPMNEVYFINRFKGWAVAGGGGELWFTNDGGVNWELNQMGYNESLISVFFKDSLKGYVVGSSGLILKTTDGGVSWVKYISNIANNLNCIKFVNEQTGWIVGNNGIILKTTNGGVTFMEEEPNPLRPNSFLLSQNYPNPFNPTTTMQYTLASRQFVTLKVYDLLGREVATLVNEEKPAGEYEVEFSAIGGSASGGNAYNLTSGIYFYQLQAGEYSETRKMVLLK